MGETPAASEEGVEAVGDGFWSSCEITSKVMLKPKRLACLALLLVGLAGVCLHPAVRWRVVGWYRGEAFYQGRPTSYWAEQFANWPDSWGHRWLPGVIADWLEPDGQPSYPGHAFYPEGCHVVPAEAIPVLVELLGEEDEAGYFAFVGLDVASSKTSDAIAEIVRNEVPKIVGILRSPSCKHHQYPIRALGSIGHGAEAAVPALIQVVREADTAEGEDVVNVFHAVVALEAIGPGAREAISVLEQLRDGEAGRKSFELRRGRVTLRSLRKTRSRF